LDKEATLGDVASVLSHQHHRVLIGQGRDAKLVSQSDIVRYLSERKDQLDPKVLNTPVGQLNVIHEKILHVSDHTATIKALCHLVRNQVGALGTKRNSPTPLPLYTSAPFHLTRSRYPHSCVGQTAEARGNTLSV
jgi:hypothetical protein